jgi:hypothetical protein
MRSLILPIAFPMAMVIAGCGGGSTSYDVGTYSLNVADKGYFLTLGNDFCTTGTDGQLKLDFVDFDFICDPKHPQQRDANVAHVEMQIILNIGTPPTYDGNFPGTSKSVPYPIEKGDCVNGLGSSQAHFFHYAPQSTTPDMDIQADSGSVSISQFDATGVKPMMGKFDLHFGAKEVKDTFSIFSCSSPTT